MVSLAFLAPLVLLLIALYAWRTPGRRPDNLPQLAEYATLAAVASGVLGLVQFATTGSVTMTLFAGAGALVLEAGAVSLALTLLVAFIGWVVIRYSRT